MEFDTPIVLVTVCCLPHFVPTQTHPLPLPAPLWAQADWPPQATITLVSNWVQTMGALTGDQRLEREDCWAGQENSQGISFHQPAGDEALAGLCPSRTTPLRSGHSSRPPTWTARGCANAVSSFCLVSSWGDHVFCPFLSLVLHHPLWIPFTLLSHQRSLHWSPFQVMEFCFSPELWLLDFLIVFVCLFVFGLFFKVHHLLLLPNIN